MTQKPTVFNRKLVGKIELRDVLAVLILLLLFGAQLLAAKMFPENNTARTWAVVAYMIACIVFSSFMYRDMLKADWKKFCAKWWLNIPLAIGGGLVMLYVLLPLFKSLIGVNTGADDTASIMLLSAGEDAAADFNVGDIMPMMLTGLIGAIPAVLAPFMEEIVFRHVLFAKWRDGKASAIVMILVSSFLFGLIHLGNFGGNFVQTIPYMLMGLCIALINWVSKSIWSNIGAHFVINFVNSAGMILWAMFNILRAK